MEKRILAHEKFIQTKLKNNQLDQKTINYHKWMVANFQHERLVHLFIMLTFVILTICIIVLTCWLSFNFSQQFLWPIYLIVLILTITSIFYVKHYYFLENHIQKLYDLIPEKDFS